MGWKQGLGAVLLVVLPLGGLNGCAAVPRQPLPLVAVPGPTKTEAQFQQDDTTCRVAAVELPPADAPQAAPQAGGTQPVVPTAAPGTAGQQMAAQPGLGQPGAQSAVQPDAMQPPSTVPLGVTYLRCMEARGNLVGPLEPDLPVAYGYYPAHPVWAGYSDTYPWLYGGFWGFGYYGGRYAGYRPGWHRGFGRHYGFRDWGFRDRGFRDRGFRDWGFRGGFRDRAFGGGFRDGSRPGGFRGFHGGGFRGGFHGGGRGGGRR